MNSENPDPAAIGAYPRLVASLLPQAESTAHGKRDGSGTPLSLCAYPPPLTGAPTIEWSGRAKRGLLGMVERGSTPACCLLWDPLLN